MSLKKNRNALALSRKETAAARTPDDYIFMKKVTEWVKKRGWDGRSTSQCSKAVLSAAKHWAVSTDVIYKYLRVSQHADAKVKHCLMKNKIPFSSAYELAKHDIDTQEEYLRMATRVSHRQLKKAIAENLSDSYLPATENKHENPDLQALLRHISELIGEEVIVYESKGVHILRISFIGINKAITLLNRFQADDSVAVVDMITDKIDPKLKEHIGKIYMRFNTSKAFSAHLNMIVNNKLQGNPNKDSRK